MANRRDRDSQQHLAETRRYRNLWLDLLIAGDPATEPQARQYAQMAGISGREIDHEHALHFKPKAAAVAAKPTPAVETVDRSDVPTTADSVRERSLDERMEEARDCRGSFKGK